MSTNSQGSLRIAQFTQYESGVTDHINVNLYHGFGYPPNGPYQQHFTSFPFAQYREAFFPSIWAYPCIPQVPSPPCINQSNGFQVIYGPQNSQTIEYYAPHRSMSIYFSTVPIDGDIFCSQPVGNVLILDIVSRENPWEHQSSGYLRNKELWRVHETYTGVLLMLTCDDVLGSSEEKRTLTSNVSSYDVPIHITTYPRDGDIFCSQRYYNLIILDIISPEKAQEFHGLHSSRYPRDRDLYYTHEADGGFDIHRWADDIMVFHEENRTSTYYLPEKDIAFHFTRIPRDGDIFCSWRIGDVVILDTLAAETSGENHTKHYANHPWDRGLYLVHEENGGFSLINMENSHRPAKESYSFFEINNDEEYSTFTYYLHDMGRAFHFNKLPAHGDLFRSQIKNNIMLLELCPIYLCEHPNCSSGNTIDRDHPNCCYGDTIDRDVYRVQQRDAGFELVKIDHREINYTFEYKLRLGVQIRRYTASTPSSDDEDSVCTICLGSFKNFDRIGSLHCGHEYHFSCIVTWLPKSKLCPLCRADGVPRKIKCLCIASASPLPSLNLLNLSI